MPDNVEINVVRAFVDKDGKHGNPTGIVLDLEQKISPRDRQKVATDLHFTETVFINRLDNVEVSFYNPQQETKFAGDALISTAYFIRNKLEREAGSILCKGGRIKTWSERGMTWIEASLEGTPGWQHQQLASPEAVDHITAKAAESYEHTMVWTWEDERAGRIRSRTFLPDWGDVRGSRQRVGGNAAVSQARQRD